jgi:hypothetical protein
MRLTVKKWIVWWGLAGLLVPVVLLLRWKLFGHGFGEREAILWPSSLILMALEGPPEPVVIAVVYAIAVAANITLYSVVGLLSWFFLDLVLRRRAQGR